MSEAVVRSNTHGVAVDGAVGAAKGSGSEVKRRLVLAWARLHALRLVVASGSIPPLPVHEQLVSIYHESLEAFIRAGGAECKGLRMDESEFIAVRVGRGRMRAPRYERYVQWPAFVTRLHTALLFCEYLLSELDSTEHLLGFGR